MTAVDETTDTRAQDAAWWAMDVVCVRNCGRVAVWQWCQPCGCRPVFCGPCKQEHAAYMARMLGKGYRVCHCHVCGKTGLSPADHYWRPL